MLFCLLDSLLKIIDVPNKTRQKTHDRLVPFSLAKELMCYVLTTKMLTLPPATHQQTPNKDATKMSFFTSPPWSKCDQKLRRLRGLRCQEGVAYGDAQDSWIPTFGKGWNAFKTAIRLRELDC